MNSGVKSCPFCGNQVCVEKIPLWRTRGDGSTSGYFGCYEYDIHCDECGCRTKLPGNNTIYSTDKEAKENVINALE